MPARSNFRSALKAEYTLAGIRIVSDLPLSGLPAGRSDGEDREAVVIQRGDVPETLPAGAIAFPGGQCTRDELLLNIPQVARYLVRGGREILVDQSPNASNGDVYAYLLGTALGVLFHQRGTPPLHASAIDGSGGCIAFVGESGAGKSTLVAALVGRGHEFFADDVCFLQAHGTGAIHAWPGLLRIRLWEDAMAMLGRDRLGAEREFRGYDKFLIPVDPTRRRAGPRPLRRVYQLQTTPTGSDVRIERLNGSTALESLMKNIYRLGLAEHMGHKPAVFRACAAAARQIAVFKFSRPIGFDVLHAGIDLLERHLSDLP